MKNNFSWYWSHCIKKVCSLFGDVSVLSRPLCSLNGSVVLLYYSKLSEQYSIQHNVIQAWKNWCSWSEPLHSLLSAGVWSNRWRNVLNCLGIHFNEKNHYSIEVFMEVLTDNISINNACKIQRENMLSFTSWERAKSSQDFISCNLLYCNTTNNFTSGESVRPDWGFAKSWSEKGQENLCMVCYRPCKPENGVEGEIHTHLHIQGIFNLGRKPKVLGKGGTSEVGHHGAGKDVDIFSLYTSLCCLHFFFLTMNMH